MNKKFTKKALNIKGKETRFSHEVKKEMSPQTRQCVAEGSTETVFESPESCHLKGFRDITVKLGSA